MSDAAVKYDVLLNFQKKFNLMSLSTTVNFLCCLFFTVMGIELTAQSLVASH